MDGPWKYYALRSADERQTVMIMGLPTCVECVKFYNPAFVNLRFGWRLVKVV